MLKYLAVAAALSMGLTFASSPAKAELIYVFSFLGGEVSGEIDLPDTCSPSTPFS
jgi:hypothetical protein